MTADLRCDFPCDDDCEADCHQAHLPIHKRRPDMCGCVTRTEVERLRERAETAEASNARARAIHPSREEADAAENALCPECIAPAPCRTRRALDGQA